jgi:hypothetical protein
MRRLMTLIATLSVAIVAAVASPGVALAANSTCSVHDMNIIDWSNTNDWVEADDDFKCGGANNEGFNVTVYLQWRDSTHNWTTPQCDNGNPCWSQEPSATGYWSGGSDHYKLHIWNVAGQVNCRQWRTHAIISFNGGSPYLLYNSNTITANGC